MTEPTISPPPPPRRPLLEEFGLTDADLTRLTLRDILLSDGFYSVTIVLITVAAIWRFMWWGIAVACVALGLLYLFRLAVDWAIKNRLDRAREAYGEAMEAYTQARRIYDNAMYDLEKREAESRAES